MAMGVWGWLSSVFTRRQARDTDLEREVRAHLDLETEEQRDAGVSYEEARYAASRAFGNASLVKEDTRTAWRWTWLEDLAQDLRYGFRMLRANLGFTAVAALSLALGIGGNAAMFSLVDGVLLQPLPYPDAQRLVTPTGQYPKGAFVAIRERSKTMDVAAYTYSSDPQFCRFNLTGEGEAVRLLGSSVSANLFSVLAVGSELGRTFAAGDDQPGRDRLVVLSHALWRSKFASDPRIIGRSITIDGVNREVVGVMPANFAFPSSEVQIWMPLHLDPSDSFDHWNTAFMPLVARLRPGATLEQAASEIRPVILQVLPLFPYNMPRAWNANATAISLQQSLVGDIRSKLIVLQVAVGVVLLITCVNVASLLLSRAAVRQKEMALRSALGAARGRILRQLLTESVVLALVGGCVGLALAYEGLAILKLAIPVTTPGFVQISIDWRVLAFVTLLAIGTGLIFGIAPAVSASRTDLAKTMRIAGRRSSGSVGARFRGVLIACETGLAVLLAVSAGLLIKSLWHLTQVDPGFRTEHVLTVSVFPDQFLCQQRSACVAFYRELIRRAHEISGVSDVAAVNAVPLSGDVPTIPTEEEGHALVPGETLGPLLWAGAVTTEYFRVMGIPLLEGRTFDESDTENSAPVVVISQATARRFWPGEDPIGKHIRALWDKEQWRTVVGVVSDVRQFDLSGRSPDWITGGALYPVYMPYPQAVGNDRKLPTSMALLLRTNNGPTSVAANLRDLVAQLNPNVPVGRVQSMQEIVTASTASSRSMMWLFVIFACAALGLAAIGTYGVVSYSVAQRTYEMGVRVALGATRVSIFSLVLGQSLRLVLAGLGIGILVSLAATRILAGFLYGVTAHDPLTFLAVVVLLIAVALLAGFLPARRAASVDPVTALRAE
jgi:predicted permease